MSDPRPDSPFDELMQNPGADSGGAFAVGFRGYDRGEVDATIADLHAKLKRAQHAEEHYRAEAERIAAQSEDELSAVREAAGAAQAQRESELAEARDANAAAVAHLESELAATRAQIAESEQRVAALAADIVASPEDGDPERDTRADDATTRERFEAVLRVAEEQASLLIDNAATQAERLLESAREDAATLRADAQADIARITAQAQHDADQVRLRTDTESTAHEARIEREAAHAAEQVAQAQREADAVRTEAEKGAAALRSLVTRETTQQRTDAEREVREMNARALEFEETLTRRQDDAQQEFLVLHNQAVAHAERITSDANAQVASSLEHAQRISSRADDYEKLARAQASQIEAEAHVRAQGELDRARAKAQKIVTSVTDHTAQVLRDAEDRSRQLRWQQQQLNSFMSEVRELIRPDGILTPAIEAPDDTEDAGDDNAGAEEQQQPARPGGAPAD